MAGGPRTSIATILATGGAMALMARINGQLAAVLGSPELAAAMSATTSVVALSLSVLVGGSAEPVRRAWRARRRVRPSYLVNALAMAVPISAGAYSVTRIGVSLTTMAFLAGQMAASLIIDRLGIGPAGRRPLTASRAFGAALAGAAIVLVALHDRHRLDLDAFAIAVGGGAAAALAFTALAQMSTALGDLRIGAATTYVLAAVAASLGWLVLAGAPGPQRGPGLAGLGGILAAAIAVATARLVARFGSLRVGIGFVAGQSLVAVVLDVVLPVPGVAVMPLTLITVGLVLAGAVVSGRGGSEVPNTLAPAAPASLDLQSRSRPEEGTCLPRQTRPTSSSPHPPTPIEGS